MRLQAVLTACARTHVALHPFVRTGLVCADTPFLWSPQEAKLVFLRFPFIMDAAAKTHYIEVDMKIQMGVSVCSASPVHMLAFRIDSNCIALCVVVHLKLCFVFLCSLSYSTASSSCCSPPQHTRDVHGPGDHRPLPRCLRPACEEDQPGAGCAHPVVATAPTQLQEALAGTSMPTFVSTALCSQ